MTLFIDRSVNRDSATYALAPAERDRVKDIFGDVPWRSSRVVLAHGSEMELSFVIRSVVNSVAILLTGSPVERLPELGEIVFRDPTTGVSWPILEDMVR